VSAAGAGVGGGGAAVAVAGTSTLFQSAPGSTIRAISSPTAISGQFSGFCTCNSNSNNSMHHTVADSSARLLLLLFLPSLDVFPREFKN